MGEICYFIELLHVTRQKLTMTKQGRQFTCGTACQRNLGYMGPKTLPSGYHTDITILVITIF